ncbi:MAG: P-loop NTPase [Oscillospiraceae bacterium]|jgi:septum site-determining protein MinD|nr:P-loop NTPase [Oscillospiraceae bacterium]
MGEVVSVISGKGGTGKTSICAALASCLAADGARVLCIDTDIGLRNLDIALGMSRLPIVSFTDVLNGYYSLEDATTHATLHGLSLFTAPVRDIGAAIEPSAFGKLLTQVRKEYDWCFIDAAAGIGDSFRLATQYADNNILVSTPDPASLRDAGRVAELLSLAGKNHVQLIVNRVQPKLFTRMDLTVDDIMDDVGLPLLGLVPEDTQVVLAAANGKALILHADDGAALACLRISRRLRGQHVPLTKL